MYLTAPRPGSPPAAPDLRRARRRSCVDVSTPAPLTELARQCNLEWLRSLSWAGCGRSGPQVQGVGLENGKFGNRHSWVVRTLVANLSLFILTVLFAGGADARAQVPVYTPPPVP